MNVYGNQDGSFCHRFVSRVRESNFPIYPLYRVSGLKAMDVRQNVRQNTRKGVRRVRRQGI